jgi:hypothetical protein
MGAFCLLLSLATGVDYGWQPAADGSLTYLIQVEPELVDELRQPGFAIESDIPDSLRGVRRFKIYVGRGPVPRVGAPHAAVQAQWSQYVEPTPAAGASGTQYLNQNVPPNDPYGVASGFLPPVLQTPVWSEQAVTKESLYSWSELGRLLSESRPATTNAGADAPPLTLPPDFQQGIAALPDNVAAPLGNAWNQATQTLAERGLDPRQILPHAEDRIKQEWNAGVAGAEAAFDRFGNRMADQANRTVGAWTGTEITRSPNPAAASSPVGSGGGAFAAAPPVSQPAFAPPATAPQANQGSAPAGLGMPAGPSFSPPATNAGGFNTAPPRDFASGPAFNAAPPLGAAAPPWGGASANGGLGASPLAGGPLPGGNSLDGGGSFGGGPGAGSLSGGSSLDAAPLAGAGLGSAPPLGGSLDGGGSLGGGSSLGAGLAAGAGGWDAGGSLGGPPAGGLGNGLDGSLGGGGGLAQGPGSIAGGGSSLGGDALDGTGAGGSLGGSVTPGDQPFGVPQLGGSRPDDDNPFGVPIVARTEVARERRTLPYAAVPIRPDFSSDLLAGPSTIEATPTSAAQSPFAWNWGGSFDQNGRPWGPLFLTAVILFLSVGLNCYLAWISRGLYERYKNLVFTRRHPPTSAAV